MKHISLGILILFFGASLLWRRRSFWFYTCRFAFYASPFLIFLTALYRVLIEYRLWSEGEVSRFLLPPYREIDYFIFYVGSRFFAPSIISLILGLLFLYSARILNRKYDERFFEPEEPYLGAIAIFLSGHPGWLFYAVFLLLIYLLIHLYSLFIVHNSSYRVPLYYLWLPTAIFVILITGWLQDFSMWQILKI